MGLFRRKKPIPGVDEGARATGDFDVVIRSLVAQMTGAPVEELGNDAISAAGTITNLANLRAGWNQRPPGDREIWLRNAIHGMYKSELRSMDRLDTSMLRPGIRSQWTANLTVLMAMANTPGSLPDPSARVAHRPMADGIVRCLIWDTPTTMALVNEAQLADWGADFDQLWDVAVANLAADPKTGAWAAAADRVWISLDEDDYAAERIFVPGHLDGTNLGEHMVMFHPTRNVLILADLMDPKGIAIAAEIAQQHTERPNPVSFTPIVGRGLAWHPLVLDDGHPAAETVAHLRAIEQVQIHGHQQQLLTEIHGDDLFVGTYKVVGDDAGNIMSMSVWTETVDTLLPRTDRIAFVTGVAEGNPQGFDVDWATAESIVGHHMEPTAHYPERFRVARFPNADELARMRQLAG